MEKICRNKNFISIFLSVVLSFAFVAVAAYATTIGTNISATGTVGVASSSPYVALGVTGTTTSTAGMVIGSAGTALNQVLVGTCSVNPQSITAATSSVVTTSCEATGVASGDKVFMTPPSDQISNDNWLVFEGASASSTAGYIEITLFNASTTADIDGSARTWTWMAIR